VGARPKVKRGKVESDILTHVIGKLSNVPDLAQIRATPFLRTAANNYSESSAKLTEEV
jgi:hypothetical protein